MTDKYGKCLSIPEPGCAETNSLGVCTSCEDGVLVHLGKCDSTRKCN